jgi:hypothetical protein
MNSYCTRERGVILCPYYAISASLYTYVFGKSPIGWHRTWIANSSRMCREGKVVIVCTVKPIECDISDAFSRALPFVDGEHISNLVRDSLRLTMQPRCISRSWPCGGSLVDPVYKRVGRYLPCAKPSYSKTYPNPYKTNLARRIWHHQQLKQWHKCRRV